MNPLKLLTFTIVETDDALRAHWLTHKPPQLLFPGLGQGCDAPMDRGGMSTFIELLRRHKEALEHLYANQLNQNMRSATQAMLRCQTEQQGRSQWFCSHCHHDDRLPLSCGHRHCSQCQQRTTADWLQRQQQKRLTIHYFMVTFTLPYQLRVLARHQPKATYNGMFKVA